jgi:diacylglycerol kinase family enzyme
VLIPAFVNDAAGTASAARHALEESGAFEICATSPGRLESSMREKMTASPPRLLIAGGDGSIATAARVVSCTDTTLAVLPGGTLNHFARGHGIPTDPDEAVRVALSGEPASADVAFVGDRLFLNTSSVGAYVGYVRLRDRAERYVGYHVASVVAAIWLFVSMRTVSLELDVEGERRNYSTPIVFIGVGERETRSPMFGSRVQGGRQCLHVIVVRERRAGRLLALAVDAATRGLRKVARTPEIDSFMVDSCVIRMSGQRRHVAIDGEIVNARTPLEYRLAKDALKIIVPAASPPSAAGTTEAGAHE